ncbi:O-antigen ligase family protein [Kangiella sp. HZ709]|uniref:O-antigen ligase family protein n=1 Tax=Kangiella sp. HZ709 TaxID=2666328 RepID=UPI0012AFD83E|nr:O-antigen ligase family protein [Kangiella sp. HZ709]MRX27167.1 hypothetical protein [Kangiella sp. HZ709]
MSQSLNNKEKYWAYFIGLLLPLAVILAPSNQANLAEHMFTKAFAAQILIVLGAAAYLLLNRKNSLRVSLHPLAIILYITFMLGFASTFWSDNHGFAINQLAKWSAGLTLAFLVFQIRDKSNQRLILQLFVVGALLLASIGIIQYLLQVDIVKQAAKPASTFANKNMAAQIAVLTWPIGVYLFVTDTAKNSKWLFLNAITSSLLLVFIFYTQTQAAWLSVIGQLLLLSLVFLLLKVVKKDVPTLSKQHKKHGVIAIIILLVLINVSNDGVKPFWEKIQQGADKVVTRASNIEGEQSTIRFQLWDGTLEMAKSRPVYGIGLGNYYHHSASFSNGRTHTIRSSHNDYLQTLAELGFSSSILMISSWILLGFLFFRFLFKEGWTGLKELSLIIAIGGMAITSMFSFPLQLQTPILIITTYIAIILASAKPYVLPKNINIGLLGLSSVVALVVISLNLKWNSKLSEFNSKVKANDWKQEINFGSGSFGHHPMFKWFSQRVSREYMYSKPGSAVKVANSYLPLAPTDAVLINNKIYGLIKLKRFKEASELILKVREFEPPGYYRSYYNELILETELQRAEKLGAILNGLDKEKFGLLSMKPETLDNMSVAAFKINQKQRAIDYLQKNIEVHPAYVNSYEKIISMLKGIGKHDSAAKYQNQLALIKASRGL